MPIVPPCFAWISISTLAYNPLSPNPENVTTNAFSLGPLFLPDDSACGIIQQLWHVTATYCARQ